MHLVCSRILKIKAQVHKKDSPGVIVQTTGGLGVVSCTLQNSVPVISILPINTASFAGKLGTFTRKGDLSHVVVTFPLLRYTHEHKLNISWLSPQEKVYSPLAALIMKHIARKVMSVTIPAIL